MNPSQPPLIVSLAPVIAIFAIFYFLVIRPQQKQMKELKQMLDALKKGDRVLTSGGLYGTIVSLRGPDLEVKIAENMKVLMTRASVTRLANPAEELLSSQKTEA